MCGIAGVFQLNGMPVPTDRVEEMGLTMSHRGPDNFGTVQLSGLGMAHNRLSLIDLSSAANQPFRDEDHVLSYNGEIYNFREIRKRLERDYGVEFSTTSDTEVLFRSLIYDGIEECLKGLQGMFAFSFYDRRKNELYLARDRVGIKPLYYASLRGGFYWASEVKAIARSLGLKPDPIKTLFSISGIGENSSEFTLFKEIFQVRPATFMKVTSVRAPETVEYYRPADEFDRDYYDELDRMGPGRVTAEFDRLFNRSIESMLVSDAPLGAFVSGGVDSALIASAASRKYSDFKLFTANVLGRFSEFADTQILASHIGAEIIDYKFEPGMMLRDWADVTYFYESPIVVHTNAIPFANVAAKARDSGVKAVLTGEGADELFLGYPRLLTKRFDKIAALPNTLLRSIYKIVPGLSEYLFPERKQSLPDFSMKLVANFESAKDQNGIEKFDFLTKGKREEQYLTIKLLGSHLATLLHRNDRMGMMASIEARFPFLHEDVIRFAINLPIKYKIGSSIRWHNYKHPFLVDKWIVRKTAESYLPRSITRKKKFGFSMYGHKFLRIKDGFFDNGWVSENLSLTRRSQRFLLESQDPYFIGKLASVEVFGRIFAMGECRQKVKEHILRHSEMAV